MLLEPGVHVEEVVLLRPEHARQRLPVDPSLVLAQRGGGDPLVELVGVGEARGDGRIEALPERRGGRLRRTAAGGRPTSRRRHVEDVAGRGLRAGLRRVDGLGVAGDDILVERVLDPGRSIRLAPEALGVALVLGEEQLGRAVTGERVVAQLRVRGADRSLGLAEDRLRLPSFHDQVFRNQSVGSTWSRAASGPRLWTVTRIRMSSGPSLAYSRKTSKYRSSSKMPVSSSSYSNSSPRPPPVRFHQVPVRELPLRILVEVLHVRVRGRRVEVEVVLLDVLAVVPLAVGEPEEALLEDGVALVPEGEGKAEALLVVGDPAEAILAPAIGARAGLVVAEVVPRVAVLAVVLAHRAPLPLAQVGPPLLPGDARLPGVVQPFLLGDVVEARGCGRFGRLLLFIGGASCSR